MFPHLFTGILAICFPICFPISVGLGKHGETFGKTFSRFCDELRDFAFRLFLSHYLETSLFIGFSTIFKAVPTFCVCGAGGSRTQKVEHLCLSLFYSRSLTYICINGETFGHFLARFCGFSATPGVMKSGTPVLCESMILRNSVMRAFRVAM